MDECLENLNYLFLKEEWWDEVCYYFWFISGWEDDCWLGIGEDYGFEVVL